MGTAILLISRCRCIFGMLLTCVWFSWFCSLAWTKEDANLPLPVSNQHYQVNFTGETWCENPPGMTNYVFDIANKNTHQVRQLVLRHPYKPIDEVHLTMLLPQNTTLVIQTKWKKRPRASTGIHIVDLESNKLVDEFWCYEPVLSPSKRFLVYEKFYPCHGLAPTLTTVVLMYDMRKPPSENRVPVVGYTEWPKEQVGLPVYPQPYVKARAYVLVEQQLQNTHWYLLSSPFLWSADGKDVVFLCNHKKQAYIVRVNISAGIDKPKIFEAPVIVGNFVKPDLPEEYRKKEAARLHTVSATEIIWDGKDHVLVKPNKAYYTLQDKIRLPVP